MKLYTNQFSPFARKVMLALNFKKLAYESVDGLAKENHEELWLINPRGEVPTLQDGDTVVSQSAHILAYLEDAYPEPSIYPPAPSDRAIARRLEHLFDTRVDALIVDASLWTWAEREDERPDGLMEAAQADLDLALADVEDALSQSDEPFMFGDSPGSVEFSLWPHLTAVKPLGFSIDKARFPKLLAWFAAMKSQALFQDDAKRTADFLRSSFNSDSHEKRKIAWRGDRIEWILSRGYHDWFFNEIKSDRVIWPLK